jgi:hypothetical protein
MIMIQPDSIKVMNDSISDLSADSLSKLDSLTKVDSLHVADSIKLALLKPTGFIGIPHPSLPQNESWVFIALFFLFAFLVFSVTRSSGLITDSIKTFFQVKERSSIFSKASVTDSRFRVFLIVFAVFVISLFAYLNFFQIKSSFSVIKYLEFVLVTSGFIGFKILSFELMDYVFLDNKSARLAKESYFNVLSFLGMLLFPILVSQIYVSVGFVKISNDFGLFAIILAYTLIIIKLFQIFFHKIVAFFYILLYLCTLEILPFFILYRAYQLLM